MAGIAFANAFLGVCHNMAQYKYPQAKMCYTKIADYLMLGGDTSDEKIGRLILTIEKLKTAVDILTSIRAAGVSEATFIGHIEELSRYPLTNEIKEILENTFYEKEKQMKHKSQKYSKKGCYLL